jgi:hypothetical protein
VYPHASDPQKDAYLRVWGSGGTSVDRPGRTPDEHSYSYLRFDLSSLPKKFKARSATLALYHVADPAFSAQDTEAAPLEVRALSGQFQEKGWIYDQAASVCPVGGADGLLGSVSPRLGQEGKDFKVDVSLNAGEGRFASLLASAMERENPWIAMALTSKLNPEDVGNRGVYKFYSKDGPRELRPSLRIELERLPLIR